MVGLTRHNSLVGFHLPLALLLLTSLCPDTAVAERLNDYILDYQPLSFNPYHLEEKHERVRRSADPYLRLNFRAYGRTFNLKLQPAKSMFAADHHLDMGDSREHFVDTSHIYEGNLIGEPRSHVHMSIHNGSVLGFINIPGHDIYHMEPTKKYFKHPQFPSIIYPESKMNLDPYRHKRETASSGGPCYTSHLYDELERLSQPLDSEKGSRKKRDLDQHEMENPYLKYTSGMNRDHLHRQRRDLRSNEKTCFMSLRADEILYNHILREEGNNVARAKKAILSMFALHITAINSIYEPTTFKETSYRGIRFQLQRSTIITDCDNTAWPSGYCNDNLDVSNFLDLTSLANHDDFCLVHTFTYRDFVGGTLGLAWVATPDSKSSGVCGKYGKVSVNGRTTSKSLNTGITTLINFNQEVASRVSQLTFAHEVGHNFGAQHDKQGECAPYGTSRTDASKGNYIMYPSANTGNLPHNSEFSSCSKEYIYLVLNKMGTPGGRAYCFKSSDAAFCGNNVVEGDEECDCGYADECNDPCCIARPLTGTNSTMCTRPSNVQCSPSEGPCCGTNCEFIGSGLCQKDTGCTEKSFCVANNATCPKATYKPNIVTFCNNHDRVCIDGECIGSVCQNINWTECFKKESEVSKKEEMCYVSCQKDANSECVSSYNEADIEKPEHSEFKALLEEIQNGKNNTDGKLGVKRPAGSACNYGKGYCDVFSKCRNYDAEGPFRQLTKLIFNPVTFENIEEWIVDHWWAVLLICIGVVVFMAVFVKLFGYNTPNEDPKKKRRAQPMPRTTNPQPNKRPANNQRGGRSGPGGREASYAPDYPMHESQPYRGHSQGHQNHGYQGAQDYPAYHPGGYGSNNNRGTHQQFDRISGPRKF